MDIATRQVGKKRSDVSTRAANIEMAFKPATSFDETMMAWTMSMDTAKV